MTPLGVTRANVRPVTCPDEGALDAVGPLERATTPRPLPFVGFAAPRRVRPVSADVTNSTRKTPATKARKPIEARRLKNAECEEHLFFMDRISDHAMILVLFGNVNQKSRVRPEGRPSPTLIGGALPMEPSRPRPVHNRPLVTDDQSLATTDSRARMRRWARTRYWTRPGCGSRPRGRSRRSGWCSCRSRCWGAARGQ